MQNKAFAIVNAVMAAMNQSVPVSAPLPIPVGAATVSTTAEKSGSRHRDILNF